MKTYETAHEFFDNVVNFHTKAAEKLTDARAGCCDDRTRMAMTYLLDYQQRMENSLSQYLEDQNLDNQKLLDTWLPYSLNTAPTPEELLDRLSIHSGMGIDDIAKLGQQLGNYVVDLLNNVVDSIASQALTEIVDNLLLQEQGERKKFTRAMSSLNEL